MSEQLNRQAYKAILQSEIRKRYPTKKLLYVYMT